MSDHTHKPIEFPEDREAFLRWAVEVDDESFEVGGLTHGTAAKTQHGFSAGRLALSRFLELSRRQRGLNVEQFAAASGLQPADLLQAEDADAPAPSPRVLFALASFLGADVAKLMELAGHMEPHSKGLDREAVRFAASSQRVEPLTTEEERLLQEFRVVVEAKRA